MIKIKKFWGLCFPFVAMLGFPSIALPISVTPPIYISKTSYQNILFPYQKPYEENYLKVSDLHQLWYAQFGNPQGIPIIYLHGGPGSGCSTEVTRFIDPKIYRIILLDQRGAGKSKPYASTEQNTTQDLINDLEILRKKLKIEKWLVAGGSWGSTLAVAYGEQHPENCLGFILRSVFLGREKDWNHFWYAIKDTFPEAWDKFQSFIPEKERKDLLKAYYARLKDPDPTVHLPAAEAFMEYDASCSFLLQDPQVIKKALEEDKEVLLSIPKILTHYNYHRFFLSDNQLLANLSKIENLPAIIIHGRYDTICKVSMAYELHKNWKNSELVIVQDAGHLYTEPGLAKALIDAFQNASCWANQNSE